MSRKAVVKRGGAEAKFGFKDCICEERQEQRQRPVSKVVVVRRGETGKSGYWGQ